MQEFLSILKNIGGNISADEEFRESLVFAVWPRAAGPELARQTAPVKFENKHLTIAALSKAWQFQLKGLSAELLYKLNSRIGGSGINYIEFVIDEEAVRNFHKAAIQDKIITNDEIIEGIPVELTKKADAIKDAELKETFLLAAGRSMNLERNKTKK